MSRTISSSGTIFNKFILPGFFLGIWWICTVAAFIDNDDFKWQGLFFGLAISLFFYWSCIRLKKVELDNQYIYVSNYLKKILIPLSEIEKISEIKFFNPHYIWITFKHRTKFGKIIMFMPKGWNTYVFKSHPLVKELRAIINSVHSNSA